MKSVFHKSSHRGSADHGWLKANHSFSFANYYDNEKIHFGKLRVLNDDIIDPGKGFDLHPHQDMEIITIPLSGKLKHGDNTGNNVIIKTGEVQVMSAGTGIWHSEYNGSKTQPVNLFQIWIFPDKKGHRPRYEQKNFELSERINKWQLLVAPKAQKDTLWINQDAYISTIETKGISETNYRLNTPGNGVYFMLIEGQAKINEHNIEKRDAVGFWEIVENIEIEFLKNTTLLAIEVPMK